MNIAKISRQIFTQKRTDYSFTVMFLLIFSLFIFFAIRPSLTTAASLKKEEQDLTRIDGLYEDKIISIAKVQSLMEENRNEIPMLYQAISSSPQVNKMVEDIKQAADLSSFTIKKTSMGDVNLTGITKNKLENLEADIEGVSTFEQLQKFIQILTDQRRLKTIDKIAITKDGEYSSSSAQLKVNLHLIGYYL